MSPTAFLMSKERLRVFRESLKATTTTPEVLPDGDDLWKDGWRIVVDLLDQAEGMAHFQGHLADATNIERCNRIIEKLISADMEVLPDPCRMWTVSADWKTDWPSYVVRVGTYHLSQVKDAIPAVEQLHLRWQEAMDHDSQPEASCIQQAESQLEEMKERLNMLAGKRND